MENIKKGANHSQISNLKAFAHVGKTKLFWNFQFVQEVPRIHFIIICQKQILAKQRNKNGEFKSAQFYFYF